MVTRAEDLLDQAATRARIDASRESWAIPEAPMTLKARLATEDRLDRLGQITQPTPAAARNASDLIRARLQSEVGADTLPEGRARDAATLTPFELRDKYGDADAEAMLAETGRGNALIGQMAGTPARSGWEIVGDTGLDITRSFTNILGGIGGLAANLYVDPLLGGPTFAPWIAKKTEEVDEAQKGWQSEELQSRRHVNDIYSQLLGEDNDRRTAEDRGDNRSELVTSLRQIGRGILNAKDRLSQDSTVTISDTINAGASMLAVGPLARLTKSIPVAIGLMEAGSGHTATMNDVMAMSPEELEANSEEYRQLRAEGLSPDAARAQLAQLAAKGAALGTGVVGGLTGRLVSGFEGRGLREFARAGVTRVAGREAVEEGIQGAAQPFFTNIAVNELADENREIGKNVGEGLAEGAFLGSMSAGIMAAPGASVRATVGAAKATGRATVAGAKAIVQPLIERGDRILKEIADRNPLSVKSMAAGAEIVANQVPILVQSLRDAVSKAPDEKVDPETKARVTDYIGRLFSRAQVDESEVESMPIRDSIKAQLAGARTRFELINRLATFIESSTASTEEKAEAAIEMHNQLRDTSDVLGEGAELYDVLDKVETSGFVPSELSRFNEVLSRIKDTPIIRSAMAKIADVLGEVKLTRDPTLDNVNKAVAVAEITPEKMDPDIAEGLLQEEQNGTLQLSDSQRRALRTASSLARVNIEHQTMAASLKPSPSVVTDQILTETTGKGDKQPSALEHAKIITEAVRRGDPELAKGQFERLSNLAQTLQNKVAAINEHLAIGDGTQKTGIRYQNFTKTGVWRLSQSKMSVNPTVPATIDFAQRVFNDARSVTVIANSLAEIYPELGAKPLQIVPLAPELQGDPVEIARRNAQASQPTVTETVAPSEAAAEPEEEIKPEPVQQIVEQTAEEIEEAGRTEAQLIAEDREPELPLPEPEPKTEPKAEPRREEAPASERETEAEETEVVVNNDSENTTEAVEKPVEAVDRFAALKGHFARAFKLPSEARSRLVAVDRPVATMIEVLSSSDKLAEFKGGKPRQDLSPKIASQYQEILGQAKVMGAALNEQLTKQLDKVVDGKTIRQHILDGTRPKRTKGAKAGQDYDLLLQPNNKVLNLLMETEGELAYDPNLMGSAILAGIQWTLVAGRYWSRMDTGKAASILGIQESRVDKFMPDLRAGLGLVEAKQSLANMIQQFWGVSINQETDEGLSRGIVESMAGEILHALRKAHLIGIHEFRVTREDGLQGEKEFKDFQRFVPYPLTDEDPIRAYTSAIEEAVLVNGEPEYHIGTPPKNVARTQMNNPRVENTDEAKEAIRHENATPYYANIPLITLWQSLGEDMIVRLFGHPDVDKRALNSEHAKTLKGQNLTLVSAYGTVGRLISQMDNYAKANETTVEETPVHFDHNMSKVGRMQQLGQNSPQASKLVREVYLPMRSTLDLSNRSSANFSRYGLALAQALGIKVHSLSRNDAVQKVIAKLEGDYAPAVDLLAEWHKKPFKLSVEDIDTIRQALGGEVEPMAFHAVFDFARFKNSSRKARKNFETQLYVEADGVANGISNALMMVTHGLFEADQIINMSKAGVFVTEPGQTMNGYRAVDNVDLYGTAASRMYGALADMIADQDNAIVGRQLGNILELLETMSGGVSKVIDDVTGETRYEYDRGLIKNPATITIYGSGEKGIAGNIVGGLLTKIYERMSEAAEKMAADKSLSVADALFKDQASPNQTSEELLEIFLKRLVELGSPLQMITDGISVPKTIDPTTFVASNQQFDAMVTNVHQLFVKPLRRAITETVGQPVMESMEAIRMASQVQGIFLKYAYRSAFDAKLAEKTNGEFLSPKEQDELFESLRDLSPVIDTGSQRFYPAGSEKSDFGQTEFGRALDDSFRTSSYANTPENPGVRGMPMMIIGNGDGFAMQTMATMKNAVDQTIKIFDGVNMALHLMEEGSRQANEAAWTAMLQNPVGNVLQSFDDFMDHADFKNTTEEQHEELVQALFGFGSKPEKISREQVQQAMQELGRDMRLMSQSIEARHRVLKRTKLSVDQMAAVGASFQQEGEIDLSGLPVDQAAQLLNREYVSELAKVRSEMARKPAEKAQESDAAELEGNIADELMAASRDLGNGVRSISHTELKRLVTRLKIPAAQKAMLGETMRSLAVKGYRIVAGPVDNLRSWASENGFQGPPLRDGKIQGYISFVDKIVYTTNATSETLTHELIHAGTFEKLVAHYTDKSLGEDAEIIRGAIKRIEALANQFVGLAKVEDGVPQDVQDAYENTRAAMREHLRKGTAVGKAAALNEFMAWTLSNEKLAGLLSQTEASPLARLMKTVISAIKKLIWGRKATVAVADDMLSNLQFNIGILINSAPTVRELIGETGLFQHEAFGTSERLAQIEATFERKIVDYLDVAPSQMMDRNRRFDDAMMMAQEVSEDTILHFPMNMQERGLFKMVVAALALQTQLDPNSINEVGKLYSHVAKTVKTESFMPENSVDLDADRHYAQQKYDFIVGRIGQQKDTYGRSTLLSTFLALSMVSDEFRRALEKIELPKTEMNKWDSVDHALENAGTYLMDKLSETVSGADRSAPNVAAAMSILANQIVEVAQDRTLWIDQVVTRGHGLIDRANNVVTGAADKLSQTVIERASQLQARTDNRLVNAGAEASKFAAAIISDRTAGEVAKGFMSMLNKSSVYTWMHDLANEVVGRTESNAPIYDMIKLVRARVQQLRQQFREDLPGIIKGRFSRELKKHEWSHLFRVARTDLGALQGMSEDQVVEMLKSASNVAAKVSEAEEQVASLAGSNWKLIQRKSKELAEFMNTGKVPWKLLRNAKAIASLHGEGVYAPGQARPSKALVDAIDNLVTLYALDGLGQDTRANLEAIASSEPEAMSFMLSYLIGQRKDEMEKVARSGLASANHYKGYIPSEAALGASLIVAEISSEDVLLARGYRRLADYKGSRVEGAKPRRAYYFSPVSGRGTFNQGIIQNVRATASGVDPLTGFTNSISTAGQITDPVEVSQIRQRLAQNDNTLETLMPVYNEAGETIAYERAVDPIHDVKLGRNTNLAEMIGAWHGRQIEEEQSRIFNRVLAQRMKSVWAREKLTKKDEYVNVFGKLTDPVLKDAVSLLSNETRDYIESLFGKDQFWVRKDMLNDVLGYRNASLGDSWTGISRWPKPTQEAFKKLATGVFGVDAYRYLMTAERTWQNLVQDAKVLIVIKSVIVPIANLASNFIQLLSRGVPINDILRGMPKKTAEIQDYIESRRRLIEAEAELRAAGSDTDKKNRLNAEMQEINDRHRRLSIWPLIKAGEFSAISDVTITQEQLTLSEGRLTEFVEQLTNKLPEGVRTLGRYAIVSRDTALFQGLQRAIQYGDFLGKAVLYDHLTKKKGESHELALSRITEEFVNYDRLPGRARGALETNGLMWFWHFKLRSIKVGLSIIRNNPLHAFLAMNIPGLFGAELPGSPVSDNAGVIFFDGQRSAYSLGMDQLIHAHALNPWFQLVD